MLDLLYPPVCPVCARAIGHGPCEACHRGRLQARPAPPFPVRELVSLAPYESDWGRAVREAKIEGDRLRLQAVARALAAAARPWGVGFFDAVVPCPSPATRRARRGFSPGVVVAAAVAPTLGAPMVRALATRPGRRQSRLGAEARAANLARRLRVRRAVRGRVLLVDDVATTGATAAACARALVGTGEVEGVWALTVCSTTRRHPRPGRVVTISRTSVEPP